MSNQQVLPGQIISNDSQLTLGNGVYRKGDVIIASLQGIPQIQNNCITISSTSNLITPQIDDIILGLVTRINSKQVQLIIHQVNNVPLGQNQHFTGIIRQQDVQATLIDQIKIINSFKPGDIVKAKIISLGDGKSYLLSTAENHLGVVLAKSLDDNIMIPISWNEMMDPITKSIESRKCAKPE